MSLEAWKAHRRALVGKSMSRHRFRKPTPAAVAPVALADKYGRSYRAVTFRALMAYGVALAKHADIRADAIGERDVGGLTFHFSDLIRKSLSATAADMTGEVSDYNKEQVGKVFQEIVGIPFTDTPALERKLNQHLTDNVNLITGMTDEMLSRVRDVVDNHRGGVLKDFMRDLQDVAGVGASRAELIARDQTLKLNGALTKERHKEAGIERYEWVPSEDARVREIHYELGEASKRGVTYAWDDPPVIDKKGRKGHPGFDYQCRCSANPVIDLDLIADKHNVGESPPTWMAKTKPEMTAGEAEDFDHAPVGFISKWQLEHGARGVNPYVGPSWFGKSRAAMTLAERRAVVSASESLKAAHDAERAALKAVNAQDAAVARRGWKIGDRVAKIGDPSRRGQVGTVVSTMGLRVHVGWPDGTFTQENALTLRRVV